MANLHLAAALLIASNVSLFAAADPGLLNYLPPGTHVLMGIDVQNTRDSELAQIFISKQKVDEKLQRFMQQTGFDPRRDLQYVLVAGTGAQRGTPNLVVARGSFDVGRLTQAAIAKGGKVDSIGGVDIIQMSGPGTNALAFPAAGIAVAGPRSLVRSVVSGRSAVDPGLNHLIAEVSGSNLWFASTAPLSSFPSGMFEGQASPLGNSQVSQSILQENGSVQFGQNIEFAFNAVTRSPQDAKSLENVIRFLTNMLESKAQSSPASALLSSALVQNLQMAVNGSQLQVRASLPEQVLEEFLSQANSH